MAEGIKLPDGAPAAPTAPVAADPVDAGQDFARLMASASAGEHPEETVAAPSKRTVPTSKESAEAIESRTSRARTAKADKARTSKAPKTETKLPGKDFSSDLQATADALWLGASQIPMAAPYAAVFHANTPGLVAAVNAGAQVNQDVRNFCDKLTSGAGSAWMLQLGMVAVNMGMQGYAVYKNPELRSQLVDANTAQVQQYIEAVSAAQAAA
jgi:hypothetical protein